MGGARASGGQKSQVGSSTHFYVFLHKIFEFHKYRSRAWTVYFVRTQLKNKLKIQRGV